MLFSTFFAKGAVSLALAALPVVSSTFPVPVSAPADTVAVTESAVDASPQDTQWTDNVAPRLEALRALRVTVTAYSSTADQTDDTPFITANGSIVRDGIIAANFLPFGTRVRFPDLFGDKIFTVQDRMHPRFSSRADIWMSSRDAAQQFGIKRRVVLEVLPAEVAVATAPQP